MKRLPCLAGKWYPGDRSSCLTTLRAFEESGPEGAVPGLDVVGGIAPHAGWFYSGPTALLTFAAIGPPPPRTVVLLGVPHRAGIRRPSLSTAASWSSPFGDIAVDRELARALLEVSEGLLAEDDAPHLPGENSIEVLVPLVGHCCPGASILPVAVPALPVAVEFGELLGRVLLARRERSVVVGSTDLTHYGEDFYGFAPKGVGEQAHRWSKDVNDQSFLDRVLSLDAPGVLADAKAHHSACGAGAAAAAIAACRVLGATSGRLLSHVTSHEVKPDGREPVNFVGYASAVFVRP